MPIHASWLSESVLLAVSPSAPGDAAVLEVTCDAGGGGGTLATKVFSLDGYLRSDGVAESGSLILIRFANAPHPGAMTIDDLRSLCRWRFAGLTPGARGAVLAFLLESLEWDLPRDDRVRLATSLR